MFLFRFAGGKPGLAELRIIAFKSRSAAGRGSEIKNKGLTSLNPKTSIPAGLWEQKGVQGDTALLCAVKPLKRNYTVLSYRTGGSVLAVGGFIWGNVIPLQKLMEYNSVRLPPFL